MSEITEKIKKLIAQSEGTSFEAEAQTAMLMAQKLMIKHNLSMIDVEDVSIKEVVELAFTDYERQAWWKKSLARIIADNFRCEYFNRMSGQHSSKIVFIGLKDDIETAKIVFKYATKSIISNSDKFVKKAKSNNVYKKGIKNAYISGYLTGLRDKYREQVENNNWGLVLVKDPLVKEELNKFNLRKGAPIRAKMTNDNNAKNSGYRDGKSFSSPMGSLE